MDCKTILRNKFHLQTAKILRNFRAKKGANMNNTYSCPNCKGYLLIDNHLILTACKEGDHLNEKGFVLLMNPEIGNYETRYHEKVEVTDGEKYQFYCPICQYKLHSDINDNLVMVNYTDQKGKDFELHFSRIAGQKSTYKIMGRSVETFGIDAPHYLDFMHLMDMS